MENVEIKTNKDKVLRALQEIQLEALKELDRICRKHNIKYSLGGGTCLGQIRHGGFIPWDDDIDVDMTSDNYQKFLEVAPLELDSDRFFLRSLKTSKKWKRSFSRIEVKNTKIGFRSYAKIKFNPGIYIDIMEWNYLPNNKFLRKIVTKSLFYVRWMQQYKMLNSYDHMNPKYRTLMVILKKITPYWFLYWVENRLKNCCRKRKTNWIIDNAVVNGDFGGYPADGLDEYTNVKFENIIVMNKKNPHNHMATIYGDNYKEWLSPVERISNHNWWTIDFGIYKYKYDLPENYKDYISIKYTLEKLEHMKKVSLDMLTDIHKICKKNNINYYFLGNDVILKGLNIDEVGNYWEAPLKIALPRKDYDRLKEICEKELNYKYFYQDNQTDENFPFNHARLRLKYTYIRENSLYLEAQNKFIDQGFYIKLIPLDNTSNNKKKRKKHLRNVRYLNHFVSLKYKKNNLRTFKKSNIKIKTKLILLLPFSLKTLQKKLDKEVNKYNKIETKYFVDSTGYQLDSRFFEKEILGKPIELKYLNYNFYFPNNLEKYINLIENYKNVNKYIRLQFLKNEQYQYYIEEIQKQINKKIKKIQNKYGSCHLNYFDLPDYQLSILRYDEKTGKYLSNEKLLGHK